MAKNRSEEEEFERIQLEKLARLRARLEKEEVDVQERIQREVHFQRCGKCGAHMDTILFRGFEIERCSRCGAVLLDAGELEQIAGHESGFLSSIKAMFGRDAS